MDAILWLLENGVPASRLRWIVPRDAWFFNRANFQPGVENYERSVGSIIGQMESMASASSIADLFEQLEQRELLLRLDKAVQPSTFRCAVVSHTELGELRRIADIVRLGHVQAITPARIVLDQGSVTADADTLYVDCSACAIAVPPPLPVFDRSRINLLLVRTCQPLFSAALIAYVESHVSRQGEQNALCTVVPTPEQPIDWLRMWAVNLGNTARWRQHSGLSAWLMQCRLNAMAVYLRGVNPDDPTRTALLQELGVQSAAAAAKLPALLARAV
jgi:hypothetical protein